MIHVLISDKRTVKHLNSIDEREAQDSLTKDFRVVDQKSTTFINIKKVII